MGIMPVLHPPGLNPGRRVWGWQQLRNGIQPNPAPSPHPQHREASLPASLVVELSLFLLSSFSFLQAAYQRFSISKQQRHFLGTKDPRSNTSCSSSDVCLPLTTHTDTFPELSAQQRVKTKPQQTGSTGKKKKRKTRVPPTSQFRAKHHNPTAQDGFGALGRELCITFAPLLLCRGGSSMAGRYRGWKSASIGKLLQSFAPSKGDKQKKHRNYSMALLQSHCDQMQQTRQSNPPSTQKNK